MTGSLTVSSVNSYLAHKQHLLPHSRLVDPLQIARDIVALHATNTTGLYLSLWARSPSFERQTLDDTLYKRRELVRAICMRRTLHVLPSAEFSLFFQAYSERRSPVEQRAGASRLVQAGLCPEEDAGRWLKGLHRQVLNVLTAKGPATVREISKSVPELMTRVVYGTDKSYGGEFSIGSRLLPAMCSLGLLVRARPRGTWRSNLYEYTALSNWLPDIDLESVAPQEARAWLVNRYLAAFGPATFDDVRWWTGFSKSETKEALGALNPAVVELGIEGLSDGQLMSVDDAQRLRDFVEPDDSYVFLLPSLDPYIMGYSGRRRFLAPEHRDKVFDRAGNAMPTVWANGRGVGTWGQRKDGSVIYGLFEAVDEEVGSLLTDEIQRLDDFLAGEYLPSRSQTSFSRSLA